MSLYRSKFTFDDPEDSYWNESSQVATSSLFGESSSSINLTYVRTASDDTFKNHSRFAYDDLSVKAQSYDESSVVIAREKDAEDDKVTEKSTKLLNLQPREFRLFIKPNESMSNFDMPESSAGSFTSEAAAHLDYSRLKSEHRKLQKHLEHVRLERFHPADPLVTVRRLINGEPVTLDLYRSKRDKMCLLNVALDSFDGNAIIAVVLFLKRSLSHQLFTEIVLKSDIATNHYLAFCEEIGNYTEKTDILLSLDRQRDALLTEFSNACRLNSPRERVEHLKKCSSRFGAVASECKLIAEYIDLLERQIAIGDINEVVCEENTMVNICNPSLKIRSLINQPLLPSIYHCCLRYYDLPSNSFTSPLSLKEFFNVSDKQYVWTAVTALCELHRWSDIEKLLTEKKLLTGRKIVCPFAWNHLFEIICRHQQPPKELLCNLLRSVTDIEERRRLAEQYIKCDSIFAEFCAVRKDRPLQRDFLSKTLGQIRKT